MTSSPTRCATAAREVDVVPLYETVAEPLDEDDRVKLAEATHVTFTASSTVRFLMEALDGDFPDGPRVVSIGPVTSATAREHGLTVDIEATTHDLDGLIEALLGRPMIVSLLTDYGHEDDFVGVVHGVIAGIAPDVRVIDISHGMPHYGVQRGALVLARSLPYPARPACTWPWWTRRWAPSAAAWRCAAPRRTGCSWGPTTACSAWPGSGSEGWWRRSTSRALPTGSSRSARRSTGATCSLRWRPTWPPGPSWRRQATRSSPTSCR